MNNEKLAKGFDKLIREYSKDIYGDENALLMGQYAAMYHALSQSRQQGRMEMAEEILKTKFELNVDGNLFEVINPDIVSKMVTPPTINK